MTKFYAFPAIAAFILLCHPAAAAPNLWCFRLLAVDVIECNDARLTRLREELDRVYAKALVASNKKRRIELESEHSRWLSNRGEQCGIHAIEWVDADFIKRTRSCLARVYRARITALSPTREDESDRTAVANAPPPNDNIGPGATEVPEAGQTIDDLRSRMAYWETRAFYCDAQGQHFPSKEGDGEAGCDDGDSVMFNSLLCSMGDRRGCQTVAASQDADGRFWRSPAKKITRPEEPPPHNLEGGQTTFSGDHAQGLFLYYATTGDRGSFERWMRWIDSNERCLTWCNGLPPITTPRYCKNDRCSFRPGDCQILILLGARLNVAVPFCSADPFAPLPTFVNLAQTLKNTYDETLGKLPVELPGLALLRRQFDEAIRLYENAVAPLERLKTQFEAGMVEMLSLVQIEKTISALLNKKGYSRHNAIVGIMTLQNMGLGRSWMSEAAIHVAEDDPGNPFFQYVAHRRDNKSSMLPLIFKYCPNEATDPKRPRTQWAWERDTGEAAWNNRMYWDCLFAAWAYLETRSIPEDGKDIAEDQLRQLFATLLGDLNEKIAAVQQVLDAIKNLDPTKLPVPTCTSIAQCGKDAFCKDNPNNDACKIISCSSIAQCGKDAFCRDNPNNDACKIIDILPLPRF